MVAESGRSPDGLLSSASPRIRGTVTLVHPPRTSGGGTKPQLYTDHHAAALWLGKCEHFRRCEKALATGHRAHIRMDERREWSRSLSRVRTRIGRPTSGTRLISVFGALPARFECRRNRCHRLDLILGLPGEAFWMSWRFSSGSSIRCTFRYRPSASTVCSYPDCAGKKADENEGLGVEAP